MAKKISLMSLVVLVLALLVSAVGAQDNNPGRGGPGGQGNFFNQGGGFGAEQGGGFGAEQGGGFGAEQGGGLRGRDGGRLAGFARELMTLVTEQTGLTPQDVMQELRAGSTVGEILTTNGGDVEALITAVVAQITERTNEAVANGNLTQERADEILANLEAAVRAFVVEGERPELGNLLGGERGRGPDVRGELLQIIAEETGLDTQALRTALQSGQTLGEIITANGGETQAVIDAAVAQATETINTAVTNGNLTQERADEMLANLEQLVTDILNGTWQPGGIMGNRNARGVVNAVAEAASLTPQEVVQQVRDGATLESVLTTAGVDVTTFVDAQVAQAKTRLDEQVASGRMSQAVADARLNLLRVELLDALQRTRTVPAAQPGA